MLEWLPALEAYLVSGQWWSIVRAILTVVLGVVGGRLLAAGAVHAISGRLDAHRAMVLRRIVFYLVLGLAVATALNQLGFKLGVLLGAAGILSVALGFASQTSASNLISGLFLVGERPFGIGDVIEVGATRGEILSVDLLSVKLRTYDNLLVRIPNETLIKTEVVNLSRFPLRRADLKLSVARKENIQQVRELLLSVAENNVLCLEEPKPLFLILGFGSFSTELQFSVWAKRENYFELRNRMYEEIKLAFEANRIEIPFPHTSLHVGSATEPIPIRFVEAAELEADVDQVD